MNSSNRVDSSIDSGGLPPVISSNQQVQPANYAGRAYKKEKEPLLGSEYKAENARSSWTNTLKSGLLAPFRGIQFVAKAIGAKLSQLAGNIKKIANFLFFSTPKTESPRLSDKNIIQLLLNLRGNARHKAEYIISTGKVKIPEQFDKDMLRAAYYLNDHDTPVLKLDQRLDNDSTHVTEAKKELVEKFAALFKPQEYQNLFLLINPGSQENMWYLIRNEVVGEKVKLGDDNSLQIAALKDAEGIRYYINKEDSHVRITMEIDYVISDPNDPDSGSPEEIKKYISYRQDILIPYDELQKNWMYTQTKNVAPNTTIQNRLSKISLDLSECRAEIKDQKEAGSEGLSS